MSSSPTDECACCGRRHDDAEMVRSQWRADVAICVTCLEGFPARRRGLVRAVPVLFTADLDASMAFWSAAGFSVEQYAADFASAYRDGVELHLVAASPDGRNRGEAYLHVRGVDDLHRSWIERGLSASEPRDEPWEMREFSVIDPGGNLVRVGQNT